VAGSVPDAPRSTVLGVYAALSPNNSQESCLRDTVNAFAAYRTGKWAHLYVHTYGPNMRKAYEILEGVDPLEVLNGPKTRAFYTCLLEPNNPEPVCIDGHMVNVWNGVRVPLDYAGVSLSEYRQVVAGVKELAGRLSLVPSRLQAVLWVTWRRVHRILYDPQYSLFE